MFNVQNQNYYNALSSFRENQYSNMQNTKIIKKEYLSKIFKKNTYQKIIKTRILKIFFL